MAAAQAEDVRASFLIMGDLIDHHQKFFQRRANEVYAEAGRQFSLRRWDVLKYAKCLHKWWSTLKSAVFRFGKAEMLSAHFNGKPSRDLIDLPSTSHPPSTSHIGTHSNLFNKTFDLRQFLQNVKEFDLFEKYVN